MDRGAWWDPSPWGPKELDMTEQLRLLNLRVDWEAKFHSLFFEGIFLVLLIESFLCIFILLNFICLYEFRRNCYLLWS